MHAGTEHRHGSAVDSPSAALAHAGTTASSMCSLLPHFQCSVHQKGAANGTGVHQSTGNSHWLHTVAVELLLSPTFHLTSLTHTTNVYFQSSTKVCVKSAEILLQTALSGVYWWYPLTHPLNYTYSNYYLHTYTHTYMAIVFTTVRTDGTAGCLVSGLVRHVQCVRGPVPPYKDRCDGDVRRVQCGSYSVQ